MAQNLLTRIVNRGPEKALELTVGAVWDRVYRQLHAGDASSYCIFPGYRIQTRSGHYDDTGCTDQWQVEVYEIARDLVRKHGFTKVMDVGCGSGFKLMKYFRDIETVGFDVDPALSFLRETYPDRKWGDALTGTGDHGTTDIIICSDVIEHVPDPDQLVATLQRLCTGYFVISTPERELLYGPGSRYRLGPPANPTHIREWNFAEFRAYLDGHFDVLSHEITNRGQATQTAVCRKKGA